jgi:hypothetical protein
VQVVFLTREVAVREGIHRKQDGAAKREKGRKGQVCRVETELADHV